MNVNRVLEVEQGDTLNTVHEFLCAWWQENNIKAILAPVELSDPAGIRLEVIEEPQQLMSVNPFAPVMINNAAGEALQILENYSGTKIALILRPCELRTLIELGNIGRLPVGVENILLVGVDCPGVLHPDEFQRQVDILGMETVTRSVLHDLSEGHLQSASMRNVCQICGWSSPRGADVIIGVMGVDVENVILLIARDEITDAREHLDRVTSGLASEYQLSHRETILGALAEKREGVRNKMIENFQDQCPFNDLGCVLSIFANCTLCGECLKVCPIFEFGKTGPLQNASLVEELVLISRWLASCTGCGMCEQKCEQDIPLSLLVNSLNHRICQELQYVPGETNQKIPWV